MRVKALERLAWHVRGAARVTGDEPLSVVLILLEVEFAVSEAFAAFCGTLLVLVFQRAVRLVERVIESFLTPLSHFQSELQRPLATSVLFVFNALLCNQRVIEALLDG